MIPTDIKELISKQSGEYNRSEEQSAHLAENIESLGLSDNKEFKEFFGSYDLIGVTSSQEVELLDICSPNNEIVETTEWARDCFELKDEFVCLTSGEDEGFILLSSASGNIYDVSVSDLDALENGEINPKWNSFNDLIRWYLS